MRIWDISPGRLYRSHLLAEHREIHAIWNILTLGKKGYSGHQETLRWKGKLKALFLRHEVVIKEMERRGFRYNSQREESLATGSPVQDKYLQTPEEQREILRKKGCSCKVI
ncbi:MAG: pyrimidine dimer DNA glycosylase/endonuclease V [Caldiserica bacterium]|nr:pyrimidine dimer DNA glycosylase/endonuclease V [Caldisericota bacterium]